MSVVKLSEQMVDKILCLAGSLDTITNKPLLPFNTQAIEFLAAFSSELLANKTVRNYPDVVTFAYWCRKSHILKRQTEVTSCSAMFTSRIGRGLAFHITPSNIPVNFGFSFVFALLAGNSSIVRVPSKLFAQTQLITQAISAVLPRYPEIAKRCAFISYPIDDAITAVFSKSADVRMIWGGDTTIANILAMQRLPRCKDVMFSDRYSIALVDGAAIQTLNSQQLEKLAQDFYNDTYLMDQNACSSPQMVFWRNATANNKLLFWQAVRKIAMQKYNLQPQVSVNKYLQLCNDIVDGIVCHKMDFDGLISVVDAAMLPTDITQLRGVGGYFYQRDILNLSEIVPFINQQFQTLLYYGFDPDKLRDLVLLNNLRGIDRIVPFGTAMNIDLVWDGYDLISEMSRIVDVQ